MAALVERSPSWRCLRDAGHILFQRIDNGIAGLAATRGRAVLLLGLNLTVALNDL